MVGITDVLLTLVFVQVFAGFFGRMGGMGMDDDVDEDPSAFVGEGPPDYDNDVYVILAIAAVLTLLWALAAALNGNPGFTVLAIAMPATVVPSGTFALAIEHPTWWGAGFAVAGAVVLGLAGLGHVLRRKRA